MVDFVIKKLFLDQGDIKLTSPVQIMINQFYM